MSMPPPPPFGDDGVPGYGAPMPGYRPPAPMPPFGGAPQSRTNGLAVASLVIGLLSLPFCCFVLPQILAIVFGAVAIGQCNKDSSYTGKRMAIAGLVLGIAAIAILVLLFALGASGDSTWENDLR